MPDTWIHIGERHALHYDVVFASSILADVIAHPLYIYQPSKPVSVGIVGQYDQYHYLIVMVKTLPNEMWIETMYIRTIKRMLSNLRGKRVLYQVRG